MSRIALSNSVSKVILEKWGVKLANHLSLTIDMNPDSVVTVTISKILSQVEANDVMNVLGEYVLVKRG